LKIEIKYDNIAKEEASKGFMKILHEISSFYCVVKEKG
jgi:hypothetical protein